MVGKQKILVATRKGLLVYSKKDDWQIVSDHFLGIPVSMVYQDEGSGRWWVGLDHGHWGCKMAYSDDEGNTWIDVAAPKYPDGSMIKDNKKASLKYIWAFAAAGEDRDGEMYIGTEPGGLFHMYPDGSSRLVDSLWNDPSRTTSWFGAGRDFPGIHSIIVDPRDADIITVGISVAGVFQTKDGGSTWRPKNKGLRADYLPEPNAEVGQDPHLLVSCATSPDVFWQQNHCGIFRSVDGCNQWQDVSDPNGIANFGFPIAVDPHNAQRAWVAPAISDEMRIAHAKSLCICRTDDGGSTWKSFRKGLPQDHCYDLIYRHALRTSGENLVFGTTTGNLYASGDGGESWETLSNSLPMVYSISFID